MFPYNNNKMSVHYQNEKRFSNLNHPNIIHFIHCSDSRKMIYKGNSFYTSCIFQEFAPYGDLFNLISQRLISSDTKLQRHFFKQLIDGVEYLHSHGISHLDLKPENILIGKDYKLRICDFDGAFKEGDSKTMTGGTENWRPPEMINGDTIKSPNSVDIYSLGIILFVLFIGYSPYVEQPGKNDILGLGKMYENSKKFWESHETYFDLKIPTEFKALFNMMTKLSPEKRISIKSIKESAWHNGPVYSDEEYNKVMENLCSQTKGTGAN